MDVTFFIALAEQYDCVLLQPREELDACVVGIVSDGIVTRAAYSREKLLQHFETLNNWDRQEAEEWMQWNVEPQQIVGWPIIVDDTETGP